MDEQKFFLAYAECALWASQDEEGDSLDMFRVSDIHPETVQAMKEDCLSFIALVKDNVGEEALVMLAERPERAGHDFWLTREGHGAGYWDGDWEAFGEGLTAWAHTFGSFYLWVDDSTGTTTIRHN